jgi:hypothetical protein
MTSTDAPSSRTSTATITAGDIMTKIILPASYPFIWMKCNGDEVPKMHFTRKMWDAEHQVTFYATHRLMRKEVGVCTFIIDEATTNANRLKAIAEAEAAKTADEDDASQVVC